MARRGMSWEQVSKLGVSLPEVRESLSYGTPALRTRTRLIARALPDGETIVVRVELEQRQGLLATQSTVFFLTDHYRVHPMVLVRLKEVDPTTMKGLLRDAWAQVAGPRRRPSSARRRPKPGRPG